MDERSGKYLVEKNIVYLFQNFIHANNLYSDIRQGRYQLSGNPDWLEKVRKKMGCKFWTALSRLGMNKIFSINF